MSQPFAQAALLLHPEDNVAIAKSDLPRDAVLTMPSGAALCLLEAVPAGHKFACKPIPAGEPVRRYGYSIGVAQVAIQPGQWVHVHNLALDARLTSDEVGIVKPIAPEPSPRVFSGYRRPDGRVGTRNYIAVVSTVNCAAEVALQIARAFTRERLGPFPHVDGVIPIVHQGGCSYEPAGPTDHYLHRCLANVSRHPNVGACIYIGLGCEWNQVDGYCSSGRINLSVSNLAPDALVGSAWVVQDQGGFRRTVEAGIAAVERLLPGVDAYRRTPEPISALTLALQCGGSDGWSGVTANPLLGRVVDRLVKSGGTAVLSETPEIMGAEHLLTRRVVRPEVAQKLRARLKWWTDQSSVLGFDVDNNPTPGNQRGGLSSLTEKSLGAVAKGGSTPLAAVYEYADWVTERGLVFMDTPGNDPVSVTGQLAGGCNLIVFTTGRGSVWASNLAPCVRVASNSRLYARMGDDMDYDAGRILTGMTMQAAEEELLELVLAAASGKRTQSEKHGLPETGFVPWQVGSVV